MGEIKVGYHTITWGEDFERALKEIKKAGYQGFETFSIDVDTYLNDPRKFKSLLREKKLELSSLYCDGDFIVPETQNEEIRKIIAYAEFLSAIGCKQMVVGGGKKKEGGNTQEDFRTLAQVLNKIGERCKNLEVKLCFHPHWGTMVEDRKGLSKLCELTDPELIYLAPDTAHLKKGGCDPVEVFKTYSKRIKYVHFKDLKNADFVELGEGMIDLPEVYKILEKINYEGWIIVELDSTSRTPLESAKISRQYLRRLGY